MTDFEGRRDARRKREGGVCGAHRRKQKIERFAAPPHHTTAVRRGDVSAFSPHGDASPVSLPSLRRTSSTRVASQPRPCVGDGSFIHFYIVDNQPKKKEKKKKRGVAVRERVNRIAAALLG